MPSSHSVQEIVDWVQGSLVNAEWVGKERLELIRVTRPSALEGSREGDVAFFFSKAYQAELLEAAPSVLITGEAFVEPLKKSGLPLLKKTALIACKDPYYAMALISERFAPSLSYSAHLVEDSEASVDPRASVHPTAKIGKHVKIYPLAVIDEKVEIGDGSVIYPGCYLGPEVKVGRNSVLFANVSIYERVTIGDRVRIHSGSVIGSDGFGYAPVLKEGKIFGHQKIYHLGRVIIKDDVEMGANSCIDRGTFSDTIIENQVKLDNLVQVAHNVHLGEGTIACGESGFTGSSSTGRFVYVGAMSGLGNKIHVADEGKVGGGTLVSKDVEPGGAVVGYPQRTQKDFFLAHAVLNRLVEEHKRKKGRKGSSDV